MSASPETSTLTPGCSLTAWLTEFVSISHLNYCTYDHKCYLLYMIIYIVITYTGDTYNIPRVTECTRELNEWVYQGDKDKLINTPPRELPELVRRFTQDIYMCVYVQPDIAMFGGVDEFTSKVIVYDYIEPIFSLQNSMEDKNEIELKLALVRKELQEKEEIFSRELKMKSEELKMKSQELKMKSQESEIKSGELEVKNRDLTAAKRSLDELSSRLGYTVKELENTKKELEGKTKELAAHNTEAWRIPANKVTTHRKIGAGGWGEVMEGNVRVAVKKLHNEIVSPKHIEKMEREMKLLAEVRHPNLVQFIGAIFDDDQIQAKQRSPPRIVTELLDMNLRQVSFHFVIYSVVDSIIHSCPCVMNTNTYTIYNCAISMLSLTGI